MLDKIQEEGVGKAEAEKEKIIAEAKGEAEKIVAEAKAKAEEMLKKTEEKAKRDVERAENSIRQAARDISLALDAELRDRLKVVAKECVAESMSPELMGQMILRMQDAYLAKSAESPTLELIVSEKDLAEIEKLVKGAFLKSLKEKPELSVGHDVTAGIKIGFKGDDMFFDFSDDVIAELICAYVGPKLAAVMKNKVDG